jgi:hypothetical protein
MPATFLARFKVNRFRLVVEAFATPSPGQKSLTKASNEADH